MAHPNWFPDPRVPARDECDLGLVLQDRARTDPTGPFATFADNTSWDNRTAFAAAQAAANGLAALGVSAGDRVVILLPNSAAFVRLFLGATLMQALPVPIHVAMRGALLKDALEVIRPSLIVTHSDLTPAVASCGDAFERLVFEIDTSVLPDPPGAGAAQSAREAPGAWSLACLLLTSGTTGGTKAVRVRRGQLWTVGRAHFGFLRPDDRIMITTPMCHIGPLSAFAGAIIQRASMVILETFKTDTFWADIGRFGVTAIPGLGPSLLHFLNSAPDTPDAVGNALRIVNVTAIGEEARRFAKRFGVAVFSSFGMTEISVALLSQPNSEKEGSCGRPRDGIEVRLVDEHDIEVPVGQVGEIILRARDPWVLSDGYEANPVATLASWRNGWFHTGDLARRDDDGDFYFADRLKDVIRRRGENISSTELEREARLHPQVRDAAAVGVASEHGDQDVMLVVSELPGETIDPRELFDFMAARLPHFMAPRFVRVVDDLPKTPSSKVIKGPLKADAFVAGAWDRTAAGVRAAGARLGAVR